jgi:hypothetical protein
MHAYIEHNGKHYSVTFNRLWGQPSITHSYQVSTRGSRARARYTPRTSEVNPDGRLGLVILRKAAEQLLTTK